MNALYWYSRRISIFPTQSKPLILFLILTCDAIKSNVIYCIGLNRCFVPSNSSKAGFHSRLNPYSISCYLYQEWQFIWFRSFELQYQTNSVGIFHFPPIADSSWFDKICDLPPLASPPLWVVSWNYVANQKNEVKKTRNQENRWKKCSTKRIPRKNPKKCF